MIQESPKITLKFRNALKSKQNEQKETNIERFPWCYKNLKAKGQIFKYHSWQKKCQRELL